MLELVEILIDNGIYIGSQTGASGSMLESSLEDATLGGNVEIVRKLLRICDVSVDTIKLAFLGNHTDIITLMLNNTKHGNFSKAKREKARQFAEQSRHLRAELKELESWFVNQGHLDKNWKDFF